MLYIPALPLHQSNANHQRRLALWLALFLLTLAVLSGCASRKPAVPDEPPVGNTIQREKSRWVPVPWSSLPGVAQDQVGQAWGAWLLSCQKPGPIFASVCAEAQQLANASDNDKHNWLLRRLQPYRIEAFNGETQGTLTSYYEPVMQASRRPTGRHTVPLYAPPASGAPRQPWFTRQQIDTDPTARAALQGRALMYMADPIDAMILHVQGSGRVQVQEPGGQTRTVRMAFAGTNNQPFKSPSAWVTAQGGRGGSWDNLRQWAAQNPSRLNDMLWSNPRYVFFREETITDADTGPRGAQGVALTPGRSIAVDRASIPYGTPLWLSSTGAATTLNRLVIAQDTGSAITGAVRADYFAGWSPEAAQLAHRLKQPLYLWALWPK